MNTKAFFVLCYSQAKPDSSTHSFHALLQLIIDEQRQVLRRLGIQVEEILEIGGDHLLEDLVIVEGVDEEVIETILQVQEGLDERDRVGGRLVFLLLHESFALLPQIMTDAIGHRLQAVRNATKQFVHTRQIFGFLVFQHVNHTGVFHLKENKYSGRFN